MSSKIDIVEYVEQRFGVKLLESQKIFLRKTYELYKDGYKLVYIPSLGRYTLLPIKEANNEQ